MWEPNSIDYRYEAAYHGLTYRLVNTGVRHSLFEFNEN